MVISGGQIDIGKASPRPYEYFGVVGCFVASLNGLCSTICCAKPDTFKASGSQTDGYDGARFAMKTTHRKTHVVNFSLI